MAAHRKPSGGFFAALKAFWADVTGDTYKPRHNGRQSKRTDHGDGRRVGTQQYRTRRAGSSPSPYMGQPRTPILPARRALEGRNPGSTTLANAGLHHNRQAYAGQHRAR